MRRVEGFGLRKILGGNVMDRVRNSVKRERSSSKKSGPKDSKMVWSHGRFVMGIYVVEMEGARRRYKPKKGDGLKG